MSDEPSGSGPDERTDDCARSDETDERGRGADEWGGVDTDDVRAKVDSTPVGAGGDEDEAAVPGPEPNSARIVAGDPTFENAAFVLLGVVAMVLVILRLVSLGI